MGRFLLVVPPLVGHINPVIGIAAELSRRGHQVAWAGSHKIIKQWAGPDATVFDCAALDDGGQRSEDLKGPAAWRFLWEDYLIPLAMRMAPGVRDAIDAFSPDVLIADQHAIAAGMVADQLGLPWVTSASTSGELIDPLAAAPKVGAWRDGLVADLRDRLGVGASTADPLFSPYGVLVFTTRELFGPMQLEQPNVWMIGPSIDDRPLASDFPWEWLDPATPTVLVTLGTASHGAGAGFLETAVEALAPMAGKLQAVIADPTGKLGDVPDHILVRSRVPQIELLKQLDAVVCHAGHNTVCESLSFGVPLVVAPIRDDQPIIALQVVDAGAGVRVSIGRVSSERLRAAIESVLDTDHGFHDAAQRIGDSFRDAGGSQAAADRLEEQLLCNILD